jgi:hypothetical protein
MRERPGKPGRSFFPCPLPRLVGSPAPKIHGLSTRDAVADTVVDAPMATAIVFA